MQPTLPEESKFSEDLATDLVAIKYPGGSVNPVQTAGIDELVSSMDC